jgi:predicted CXXCH cytochrome family protein
VLLAPLLLVAQLKSPEVAGLTSCNVCHLPRAAGASQSQAPPGPNVCLSCHDGVLAKLCDDTFEGHQLLVAAINLAAKSQEPDSPKETARHQAPLWTWYRSHRPKPLRHLPRRARAAQQRLSTHQDPASNGDDQRILPEVPPRHLGPVCPLTPCQFAALRPAPYNRDSAPPRNGLLRHDSFSGA